MTGRRRSWRAVLAAAAVLLAGAVQAQDDQCPWGAVNTITGNYVTAAGTDPVAVAVGERCEICIVVRVQTGDGGENGGTWEEAGRVCNIWSDSTAHDVMFRIGRCGLIVPSFEGVGSFYGGAVPVRAEAVPQPPCFTR